MDLVKKKYKKSEVEEILRQFEAENLEKTIEAKERLESLVKENKKLLSEIEEYKNKDALINSSIKHAEEKAIEIEKNIKLKYSLEIENIKAFHLRFASYFNYLLEKYPYYPQTNEAKEIYDELLKLASISVDDKKSIRKAEKTLAKSKNVPFNPKQKINDYIAVTGDNGFDLDEVLNPGELHLEDLCKELGLTED